METFAETSDVERGDTCVYVLCTVRESFPMWGKGRKCVYVEAHAGPSEVGEENAYMCTSKRPRILPMLGGGGRVCKCV